MTKYQNPVLDADWPDPDVTWHRGEFVLVASSFNRSPGLPLLVSRDLVDWDPAGHALSALTPVDHYRLPRHGGGIWAPSIRSHDGMLWVFYPDPDHGIFVTRARSARGPWSTPTLLIGGAGLIDPCPLWDDDGRAYLVHAWAGSRAGFKNILTLREMTPDGTSIVGSPRTLIDGEAIGYTTLEGPKLYKRSGWYWIFAPAGGVANGWQSAFRSRSLEGPWEARVILAQGATDTNGPHQGAWVTTSDGADWFLHFQDRGAIGRVVHLQPMTWDDEGWPVIGQVSNPAVPVAGGRAPLGAYVRNVEPASSDRFDNGELSAQWHWQANSTPDWHRVGGGRLELRVIPSSVTSLRQIPNVLSQVIPGRPFTAETTVDLAGAAESRAGLIVLGETYAWIGVELSGGDRLVTIGRGDAAGDSSEHVGPAGDQTKLRLTVDSDLSASFEWAEVGGPWHPAGTPFPITAGRWVGAEVGLFANSTHFGSPLGTATFGPFTMDIAPRGSSPLP